MNTAIRATLMMSAVLLAIGQAGAADFTMRISHQFPPTHHTAESLEQFAKEVQAATKDRVEVQIFGASQLFKPNQQHAAVAGGKIEAASILSIQWGGTIPEMSVTVIPYLVTSPAKIQAFLKSDATKLLDAKMEAKGVKNIGWIVDSNDGLFSSSKAPLTTPASFQAVKVRGVNKIFDQGLIAVGAAPVSMPGSEVYQAMQTGVLDAGFGGVQAAYDRKFYEVQKYGVASNIVLTFDNLVVNPRWWKGLPADVQSAIQEAADAAVQRSVPKAAGIPAAHIKVLNDKGMQAVVLTATQEKAMAEAMQPAIKKEFMSSTGPDGIKLLQLISEL